ncbi:hypothetical protein AB4Z09_09545 [Rhodococcus sp. TAF43]|uniref:hypothetical protein n=1 Tax=unclassified Rhodococcus (in: high G+C Gram-positive bacteria) TaxID=192944 RepID=UPI0020C722A9|nr:hypothetical protein [Rhodococcus sp. W8901]
MARLEVAELGTPITVSFDDLIKYHGPNAPGGVAHAFKVLERALPLLDPEGPAERREVEIATAHGGRVFGTRSRWSRGPSRVAGTDEARLVVLEHEMTDRLLAASATEVYDVD